MRARGRRVGFAVMALAALAAGAARADAPAPGRYAGRLCVAVGAAPADCGPARIDVLGARRLNVRIADLVWRLRLKSSQVDVVLMHGTMQIDGFFAPFEWDGRTLNFLDLEKRTHYAVEIGR
ncbi:hypothetical protein [Piscinibacter sp.]|uniref:hypothetical protein n=1 Tax=Piscinibacter sp. TaxID=1903157 RepID=UPI0039E5FEC3